jgi:hypothetical protein
MEHRRSSIACTTAAVPTTAGQLVTSERGVCGGPLAFHYANLMSHTAFRQSLACVSLLYLHSTTAIHANGQGTSTTESPAFDFCLLLLLPASQWSHQEAFIAS